MKYMRIVALTASGCAFIQTSDNLKEWKQERVSEGELINIVFNNFPSVFDEYEESDTHKCFLNWIFHYGETCEMIRKGESYIFGKK